MKPDPLLNVEDVVIRLQGRAGSKTIVDTASFTIDPGESVGLVGESGSGKTMLCRALIGTLSRHSAELVSGHIEFDGQDMTHASDRSWRAVRGYRIGYVPQSSMAGLNPVMSVEDHLIEAMERGALVDRASIRRECLRLLNVVQISDPQRVLRQRGAELSGGMRQRVIIATAVAKSPSLLLADEPTTALDVTVQKSILRLLESLQREMGMAILFVSHDLAVIESMAQRVVVMYAGAVVASGVADDVLYQPQHPYVQALQASRIDLESEGDPLRPIPGDAAVVGQWPSGCRFRPRCPLEQPACSVGGQPSLRPLMGQFSACIQAPLIESTLP